jgi:hypothetical protein
MTRRFIRYDEIAPGHIDMIWENEHGDRWREAVERLLRGIMTFFGNEPIKIKKGRYTLIVGRKAYDSLSAEELEEHYQKLKEFLHKHLGRNA